MNADGPSCVIHQHISLMICEDAATLEELLQTLDLSELTAQRLGPRALLAPASQLDVLRRALEQQGVYPKLIGRAVAATPHDDS